MEDKITISILDPACAICPYLKTCKNKRMRHAWVNLNISKGMDLSNVRLNSLPMEETTKSNVLDGCKTQVSEHELKKSLEEELYRGLCRGGLRWGKQSG